MWLTHSSIENEFTMAVSFGDGDGGAIPTLTYPRQRTGATCFLSSFALAILGDGHYLFVDVFIERTCNGPVVRNSYRLPMGIIVGGYLSTFGGSTLELPALK